MRQLQVASAVAVFILVLVSAYPNGSGPTEQEGGRQEYDPQITLLDNFKAGKAAADGNDSFDSFRQSWDHQREIMVTVEQLRQNYFIMGLILTQKLRVILRLFILPSQLEI
uniref:Uncharacterized protein n=1 Tax=Plectus sambesii TaxID=2011161 RepID=A0A914X8F7_9BILA